MNTLITNAYSSRNLGDGLLVEESRNILTEAGLNVTSLLALDSESFEQLGLQLIGGKATRKQLLLQLALGILPFQDDTFDRAFAVGGGYLRFPNYQVACKTYLSHATQFEILTQKGIPFALLPASIGPLNCFKNEVLKKLAKAKFIAVRDDKSFLELQNLSNVYRVSDLSILHKIETISNLNRSGEIGLIIRNLSFPNWLNDTKKIVQIPRSFIMIQSDTGSRNDDARFIATHFPDLKSISTTEALLIKRPSLVISTRLHGAIMSINAGIPAIHLGYERKSFGVYKDLGLSEFCLPAKNLDFGLLENIVTRFQTDYKYSEYFFECVAKTNDSRLRDRSNLISLIACVK